MAVDTSDVDTTPPEIARAVIVDSMGMVVEFTEPVTTASTDGSGWSVTSPYGESFAVSSNTNLGGTSMNLQFLGLVPNTAPNMTLTYDASKGTIRDSVSHALATGTVQVQDGLVPRIKQVALTSSDVLLIRFTERVTGFTSGFSIENTASPIGLHNVYVSNSSEATLNLTNSVSISDSPTLRYAFVSIIFDNAFNPMLPFDDHAIERRDLDTQPPEIQSARAVLPNIITIEFNEDVDADATDGAHWSLGGPNAGSRTITANTDPGGSSGTMNLTLSSDLPNTKPNLILMYASPPSGGVTDGTNQLESTNVDVLDGIAPVISSASATELRTISVKFSERVDAGDSVGTGWSLGGPDAGSMTVVSNTDPGGSSNTMVLNLSGDLPNTAPDIILSYDASEGGIVDGSSNKLGSAHVTVLDKAKPKIAKAVLASPYLLILEFTETLGTSVTQGFSIQHGNATTPLPHFSFSGESVQFVLSHPVYEADPLVLDYSMTFVVDTSLNLMDGFTNLPISTEGYDKIPPEIVYANATEPTVISVLFSESVTGNESFIWEFHGEDSANLLIIEANQTRSDFARLYLNDPLPDTRPDLILEYVSNSIYQITDEVFNPLVPVNVTVADGLPPVVKSAKASTTSSIVVTLSENVTISAIGPGGFVVTAVSGTAPQTSSISGSGSNLLTLTLSGLLPDSRIDIAYDDNTGGVQDESGNPLASFTGLSAGRPPSNTVPVVNAGTDQDAAEGSTVNLDGTAADADTEDTLTYSWTHNSTLTVTLDDRNAEDPEFTAPNVAEDTAVEFTLAVSDGTATVSDKVIVTITDSANSPPSVNAGDDQDAAEGSTVNLDGTAADADTEDTLTYSWTHNSTLTVTLDDRNAEDPEFTAPNVAEDTAVEFTLAVSDGTATVSDKVIVTITDSANSPPSVNAGDDQDAAEGSTVNLDGTAADADTEDTLTYSWTHNSTLTVTLDDDTALDTFFTAPNVGSDEVVEFTLTVRDGTPQLRQGHSHHHGQRKCWSPYRTAQTRPRQ